LKSGNKGEQSDLAVGIQGYFHAENAIVCAAGKHMLAIGQHQATDRLRIPLISATYSTRSRPPIPEDLGQFVGAKRRC